jgi:hypothetical protein
MMIVDSIRSFFCRPLGLEFLELDPIVVLPPTYNTLR